MLAVPAELAVVVLAVLAELAVAVLVVVVAMMIVALLFAVMMPAALKIAVAIAYSNVDFDEICNNRRFSIIFSFRYQICLNKAKFSRNCI